MSHSLKKITATNGKKENYENKKLYPKLVYLGSTSNKPQFYFDPAPKGDVLYKFTCAAARDSAFRPLDTLRNEAEWEWKKMDLNGT